MGHIFPPHNKDTLGDMPVTLLYFTFYNDEEEGEEKKDEQLKENLMSSRIDVVTVKSHPPVSHPIDVSPVD